VSPGRRAKLVCTLGPATATRDRVRELAEAGTDVFRINLSHGDAQARRPLYDAVRSVAQERGTDLAIMADLPGPKIRLGELVDGDVRLEVDTTFELRAEGPIGDASGATTTYPALADDVEDGDRVLLSDGAVELTVSGRDGTTLVTRVVRSGRIRSGAGLNVPAERLSVPAITDRDRVGLEEVLDAGVDLVAQSFVRRARDIADLRRMMGERVVPIVAKIETRPATDDIVAILDEADAIMVARGDLGVELPMEDIPLIQKQLLRAAQLARKPVIVATQMLESMIAAPRPTRAEASDVANAVIDGTDAIMLSGETAIGEYPIDATRAAARIAEVAEEGAGAFRVSAPPCVHRDEASAVAHAAAQIANDDDAVVAIACYTETGRTAALLSSERPGVPIYAFIPDAAVRRSIALRWGVHTVDVVEPSDTDQMIALMDAGLRAQGLAETGRSVVMAASSPAGQTHTNLLKVHHITG